MKLKELIYQGFGNSQNLEKVQFGDAYNFIEHSNYGLESEEFTKILESSLYPRMNPWNAGPKPDYGEDNRYRLGIIFSHAETTYRFVRDLGKDAVSLSKFSKGKNDFEEISKDPSFIENAFRDTFKIPEIFVWHSLFTVNPCATVDHLSGQKGNAGDESQRYFDTLEEDREISEKVKKLRSLEAERKRVLRMSDIEFEIDGLQAKLFDVTDKCNRVKAKEDDLMLVSNEIEEYKVLDSVEEFPEDIERRLGGYDKLGEKRDAELVSLDSKMEGLINNLADLKLEPIGKDKLFLLSVAVGILSLGLLLFMGALRFVSLAISILSMASVAWRLISFFRTRDEEAAVNKQVEKLKEERAVIEKKFDIETAAVRKFIEKTGEDSAEGALDLIKRRNELKLRLESENKAYEELKEEIGYDRILEEKKKLENLIKDKEADLRAMPAVSMDPNDLKNEINLLKGEIGEENLLKFADENYNPPKNIYSYLLNWTASFFNLPASKIVDSLKASYARNLKILSDKYFEDADWSQEGIVTLTRSGSKEKVRLLDLDKKENFMVFFAYQFTILQLLSKYSQVPLLVYGTPDAVIPGFNKKVFLKAVNHLSQSFQVIHVV